MNINKCCLSILVTALIPMQSTYAQEDLLEEITVTGSRASFSTAEDAPVPVTVLSNETLANTGASTLAWEAFWTGLSNVLREYLAESAQVHDIGVGQNIERDKVRVIKKRLVELKKLNERWQIPPEPWTCVLSAPESEVTMW